MAEAPGGAPTRRSFLLRVGLLINAAAAALLAAPLVGYLVSPLLRKTNYQAWVSLGSIDHFPEEQTRLAKYRNPFAVSWDGATADIPCWVRHVQGDRFQVFAINCTHLGCPVRWFPESGLFMCPCHGGVFRENGDHVAGPPPRGLYQYEYKIEKGTLWVRAGRIPSLSESV